MGTESFFFFQAEDGIRDAQESRGLGDVYKRQMLFPGPAMTILSHCDTRTITTTPSSSPPSTTHSSSHFDNSTSASLTHPSATLSAVTTTLSRGKVSLSNSSSVGTKTLSRTAHTPSQSPSSSHLSSPTLATITPSAVSHTSSRSGSAPTITLSLIHI
eukprot:TRINITY_DN17626_c0_g1_i1.p1 TRINITY_DN17626_c0_g1~~TRINITY_DN17626_c0_g1_i1.p1  ORF type:complete len:158 (-),score=34.73 TRINITY_DN17626_c0_g1_i1:203-676(-)